MCGDRERERERQNKDKAVGVDTMWAIVFHCELWGRLIFNGCTGAK